MHQELICEILTEAGKQGKITLLSVLNSYDKTLKEKLIDKLSTEGTEIYKILLRWGRDKSNSWWEKYDQDYGTHRSLNSAMRLDELATVKLKPDPPSFDEKNALQFLKTLKDHERSISKTSDFLSSLKDSLSHSPPTHDNRLKKFKVTLPKFKDFHDQLKKSAPGVTAAQAFNNLSLIRKGLSGLADYRQISLHKSVKMKLAATCANKNTKKIIFDTWKTKIKKFKAKNNYEISLKNQIFEAWTQFSLLTMRKNLSKKIADKVYVKKLWKMWNKEMRKREILKSMKFTANFIHKQWLLKKSVLSLARKVNRNMTKRVVEDAAVKRLERFRVRSVFEAWLKSNRDKLEHKLTELKGYKASYRTCLKLGFKKFLLGFDILHCQNSQLQKAITYNTQKTYEKTIYSWLLGIREYRRKQIKHQKAFQFYRSNLQAYAFDVLSHIIEQSKLKNDNIIDEFDFKLKKKVIEAWKQTVRFTVKDYKNVFYFGCYKWLLSLDSAGCISNRETLFPIHFDIRRLELLQNAENNCQTYMLKRILSTWKADSKISKKRKNKFYLKKEKKIFDIWSQYTEKRNWYRYKLNKHLDTKNTEILVNILSKWHDWARIHRTVNINNKLYCEKKRGFKLNWALDIWLSKFRLIQKRRAHNIISRKFIRQKTLSKYIKKWEKKYDQKLKNNHATHTGAKFYFSKALQKFWGKWRTSFLKEVKIEICTEKSLNFKDRLTRKAVKGWKAVFPVLKYRNERMHEMRQNYVVGLAKKTIKGWKSSLLYKDTKDKLYQHLYISISLIKKRQIMKAMRLFSEWRSKQSQRDKLLVSQVHKIRKDYIVKMWYQRALLFSSCRYFAETMSRYQKRCFIKKLNENMERQHLTLAYLDIHREQILQKTVFNEWLGILLKKKVLKSKQSHFKTISRKYSIYKPWMVWRKAYSGTQKEWNLFGRAVLHIARDIKINYFSNWKIFIQLKRRKEYALQHRFLYLKNLSFYSWMDITKKRKLEATSKTEFLEKAKSREKSRLFYSWLCSAIKRQQAIFNANSLMTIRLQKWFDLWRKEFAWKSHKKEAIGYVQSVSSLFKQKRALFVLRQNIRTSRHKKGMSQKAINFYKSKALKRILAQWLVAIKEYTSNNSQVTKIVSQINKRITNESFQFWLGLIVPKIFKMRSVQRIEYVLSVKKTVLSFKKWACEAKKLTASANFNKFLVRISDKIIIKRTLKAWNKEIKYKHSLKQKSNELIQKSTKRTIKKFMDNWNDELKSKVESITKRDKSNKIYNQKLKSKGFKSWKSNYRLVSENNLKLNQFYQKTSKRLCSTIIVEINKYAERKISFRIVQDKAISAINTMKKRFAVAQLISYADNQVRLKEINDVVNEFRHKNSLKRVIESLSFNVETSRSIKLNTNQIYTCLEHAYKRIHTQASFKIFKTIYTNEKEQLGTAKRELRTASLRRVVQSWLKEARIKANLILKQEIVLKKKSERLAKQVFTCWDYQLKLNFIVKKFLYKLKRKNTKKFFVNWRLNYKIKEFTKQKEYMMKLRSFKVLEDNLRIVHLEETFIETIVAPKELRLTSDIFKSWSIRARKARDNNRKIADFIINSENKKLENCFAAMKVKNIPVSSNLRHPKLFKVFTGWKIVVKHIKKMAEIEGKILINHSSAIKRQTLKTWLKKLRNYRAGASIKSVATISTLKSFFKTWNQELTSNNKSKASKILYYWVTALSLRKSIINWKEFIYIDKQYDAISQAAFYQFCKQKALLFIERLKFLVTLKQKKNLVHEKIYLFLSKNAFGRFRRAIKAYKRNAELVKRAERHIVGFRKLKVLYSWKLWMQLRFEAHISIEENMLKAYEHYQRSLMSKAYYGWENEISSSGVKKARSIMHSIFSAWKIATRESSLLKRYLRESNLSERYMRTSRDQPGSALVTLRSVSSVGSLSSNHDQ